MSWGQGRSRQKPDHATEYNVERGKYGAYKLTAEQEKEFIRLYPVTLNYDMMHIFGLSDRTVHRIASRLKVKKKMKVIYKKTGQLTKAANIKNGFYESLKGKPLSHECYEASKRKRESGYHPLQEMRKNKRRYEAYKQRLSVRIKEQYANERKRIRLCMSRNRSYHLPQVNYTRQQVGFRYNAKRRGYILGDISEKFGERYMIYYDGETKRDERFERHLEQSGFTVKELEYGD